MDMSTILVTTSQKYNLNVIFIFSILDTKGLSGFYADNDIL